jgi:asparagine synthase (glutamine-hydrolysing)
MCGIAGALCLDPDGPPIDPAVVLKLNEAQRHRGPDGAGLWSSSDNRVVLGHRRLAIIDIGPDGAQPMSDAGGRWVITFNGEIYNYRAVRVELERAGCEFRTNSDTEVLINAVALWGEAGLKKLRGMYAFALWDSLQQELWLARDPYGIKPLYVARNRTAIWFSSQARCLSTCAPVDNRRDAAALVGFYLWGHVPEPFSWWAGIQMFPPGHIQRIKVGKPLSPPVPFDRVQDAYVREPAEPLAPSELRQLILESVQHHLVADVPVGVFLSAGVDSNAIAALTTELGTRVHTVTLAFSEYAGTPDDEAPIAEAVAKAMGSEHVTVRVSREEFFEEVFENFFLSMDQPTIDGLNTYLVSRAAASQGLKVVLSGLGGDELFGGYPSFAQIPQLLRFGRNALPFRGLGHAGSKILRSIAPTIISPKIAGLINYSNNIANAYFLRRALHIEEELDALLDDSWVEEGVQRLSTQSTIMESLKPNQDGNVHVQIAALESIWYMRNQLLRDTDWSSMAHGLEVRVPFVDIALLKRLGPAIASSAPPNKRDLAACVKPNLQTNLDRAKTGFTTPVRAWVAEKTGGSERGLRGWANNVHRYFRTMGRLPSQEASVLQ